MCPILMLCYCQFHKGSISARLQTLNPKITKSLSGRLCPIALMLLEITMLAKRNNVVLVSTSAGLAACKS